MNPYSTTFNSTTNAKETQLHCFCQRIDTPFLCADCVARNLASAFQQRQAALHAAQQARDSYSALPKSDLYEWSALKDETSQLRMRYELLRKTTASLAVTVAQQNYEFEQQKSRLRRVDTYRETLQSLEEAFLQESMRTAVNESRAKVQRLRFRWAVQACELHRLDVDVDQVQAANDRVAIQQGRMKHARGIGKIGGLPLPHAGPELFGVLPSSELKSALRLVASLTSLVARLLGILLPHPVLLQPQAVVPNDDIFATVVDSSEASSSAYPMQQSLSAKETKSDLTRAATYLSSSTASLASSLFGQSKSVLWSLTGGGESTSTPSREETAQPAIVPLSMDPSVVQQRILHAQSAVLSEDSSLKSKYALNDTTSEEFAIALQLLQNNVIALCIRAGVLIDAIWPAEAILLNLHALYMHCQEQS
jgi:hypothetical protein